MIFLNLLERFADNCKLRTVSLWNSCKNEEIIPIKNGISKFLSECIESIGGYST